MSFKRFALVTLITSMFIFIGCGNANPVLNYQNSPIKSSSGAKNLKDVRRAIILTGTRIGWQMQEASSGYIIATTFRGGHMAKVDIRYTAETFSIQYKDSSNLNYDGTNIHKTYNKWVKRLHNNIRSAIGRL